MPRRTARRLTVLAVPTLALCGPVPVIAQDAPARPIDKRGYTLADPTPRELWRGLETDRPDVTESPRTVDAGAVQLEMSFVEWTRDSEDGERVDSFAIAPFNLKLGLLNNTDLQFVLTPYLYDDPSPGESVSGLGDLTLRLKVNLWGNDGDVGGWESGTALAIMPFITLPTADDALAGGDIAADHVQGGIIIPFAMDLPREFTLGLMAEFDFVYDAEEDAYRTDFVHTAALGRDLFGELGGYVEYIGVAPIDSGLDYQASLGTGLTYALSPNAQLDAGAIFGLTESDTDDLTLFAGFSLRF
jgi:hypothetical protein